jgi:hypothetical protein
MWSNRTLYETPKGLARVGICLLGTAALMSPLATAADAGPLPEIIRGIPGPEGSALASSEQPLAYLATFPNGTLQPSLDVLEAGAMQPGDTLIPNSNPTFTPLKGEYLVGITRPVDLSPDLVSAASLWATPVNFGPGSILRLRATFIAPVGPLPGGGFAMGLVAKVGNKDDLQGESNIGVTVNVRPGFLVRFGASVGSAGPARVVLPDAVREAIFSTTDPVPFTMELTVDRTNGTATGKLTVEDQVFTVPFVPSDFLANSGPVITAAGPGIAVNSNGPGKTASVRVREFRIYTNVGD